MAGSGVVAGPGEPGRLGRGVEGPAGPASVESTVSARAERGRVRATTCAVAARTRA